MDPKALSDLCYVLALEDDAEEVVVSNLESDLRTAGEKKLACSLVACILTTKVITRESFSLFVQNVWRTRAIVGVESLGEKKFILRFASEVDQRRIISNGPWSIENSLIALEIPQGLGDYTKMNFNRISFCVQLHNVPIFSMTKEMGAVLGSMLGEFEEILDIQSRDCVGKTLRIRVIIDASKPLKRFLNLHLDADKDTIIILVRYERFPNLCYACGILGHPLRECPSRMPLQSDQPKLLFGDWICVSNSNGLEQGRTRRSRGPPSNSGPSEIRPSSRRTTAKTPTPEAMSYPSSR
ncbi:hypothetical protein UlMin_037151 [Ulmus minor]